MIRHLRVKNFKTLRDVSTPFDRRNALVGPNMSGKSNVITVLRLLNQIAVPPAGGQGLANAFNVLGGFHELLWRGSGGSSIITIEVDGDLLGTGDEPEDVRWQYHLSVTGDPRGDLSIHDETLSFSGPGGGRALIGRDERNRRIIQNPDGHAFSSIDPYRSALEFEIPDWRGNAIRAFFASVRFYALVPRVMKQVNQTVAPPSLDELGGNLSSWLMLLQARYPHVFNKINLATQDVFPEILGLLTWPTQRSTVLVASSERHLRTPVPVWQMSDGELCFIALLSLLYTPEELGAPLYCIEEPENHLHPRLLETLVRLLRQEQQALGERSAQVIVTTHSPHLVDKLSLEDLIVVERGEGGTILTRPREQSHLTELLRREDLGLGELYYSGALSNA